MSKTNENTTGADAGHPSLETGSTIRPSKVEQGVLLAARWLIEYGQPSVAIQRMLKFFYVLGDMDFRVRIRRFCGAGHCKRMANDDWLRCWLDRAEGK